MQFFPVSRRKSRYPKFYFRIAAPLSGLSNLQKYLNTPGFYNLSPRFIYFLLPKWLPNVKDFLGVENRWVLGLWMMGCFPCGGIHRRPVQSSLNNSLEFDVLDNYF